MTRAEVWAWVRYELVVVGVAVSLLAGLLLSGTVHFGAPPSFHSYPVMHPYEGAVTYWDPNQGVIAGWIQNTDDVSCPSVLLWAHSGTKGNRSYQRGYLWVGAIPHGGRVSFVGQLGYWNPRTAEAQPVIDSFDCQMPGASSLVGYHV